MGFTRDDLVTTTVADSPWDSPTEAVNFEVLQAIIDGDLPGNSPAEVALAVADLARDELQKYGTDGTDGTQLIDDSGSRVLIRALTTSAASAGIAPFSLPFRDFGTFRTHWNANGCYGSWQARRELLHDLFGPLLQRLEALASHRTTTPQVTDEALRSVANPAAIHDHLIRIRNLVESDPRAAVGNAKDLLESTAKLVLRELGETYGPNPKLPALIDDAQAALRTHAKEFKDSAAIRSLLGGLATTAKGVAELRNEAGTGHGRESVPEWVEPRHARLAVGATTVWVQFVLETLGERKRKNGGG